MNNLILEKYSLDHWFGLWEIKKAQMNWEPNQNNSNLNDVINFIRM